MGILTNPNSSDGKLLKIIRTHYGKISWLCYILGVLGIFFLPHPLHSLPTYFSENALLPGLVKPEFNNYAKAKTYYSQIIKRKYEDDERDLYPEYFANQLLELGLEVGIHNFSLQSPFISSEIYRGVNVYGILRASRASSSESIVLSVPYRKRLSENFESGTNAALSLLLTSAAFFRSQNYWAKDIIFLITEFEQSGMQAWLEAYHESSTGFGNSLINYGVLPIRAGAIQAALNLEFEKETFSHINVKIVGLNGQLPNLDLFNLAIRLSHREGIPTLFQGFKDISKPFSFKGYLKSLKTMGAMALQMASCVPTGNHGLFLRFGIEALTLEGVSKSKSKSHVDFYHVARLLETLSRSLNNLLERFHQSFFFYLLSSSSRYVSIGMYIPVSGLLCASLSIYAFGLWCENLGPYQQNPPLIPYPSLSFFFPSWILSHGAGVILFASPKVLIALGQLFELTSETSLFTGLTLCVVFSSLLFPFVLIQKNSEQMFLFKAFLLLQISLLSFCVSLLNFSLSTLISILIIPPALLSLQFPKVSFLMTLLVNPLFLLFLFSSSSFSFPPLSLNSLSLSLNYTKRALFYSVVDGLLYGNFSYALTTLFYFPLWLLLWFLNGGKRVENPLKTLKIKED